jgi:hypothetical protein
MSLDLPTFIVDYLAKTCATRLGNPRRRAALLAPRANSRLVCRRAFFAFVFTCPLSAVAFGFTILVSCTDLHADATSIGNTPEVLRALRGRTARFRTKSSGKVTTLLAPTIVTRFRCTAARAKDSLRCGAGACHCCKSKDENPKITFHNAIVINRKLKRQVVAGSTSAQ